MCGINGILSFSDSTTHDAGAVQDMNDAISHRGPDDSGVYSDGRITLGHRRLAIIDLSKEGHQPMSSTDGRFVIVFNGEIYNYRELRAGLDYPFKSKSDTEVLLAAWIRWGVECIDHLVGMFSFAIWDKSLEELYLVRDRLGIKPLYYYINEHYLIFSSELRGVLASGYVPRRLNPTAVHEYLQYQCVHQPESIVNDVKLLPPATFLKTNNGGFSTSVYWSPCSVETDIAIDHKTATHKIYDALLCAVERRMVADVPFGAFLSGGIDSSAIVALMSRITGNVNTFSVSFAEEKYSEAHFARLVANRYNTRHHDIKLTPDNFLELLPQALDSMDHPSGDGPNTYVVSGATRRAGVTMALSGLGGDELFAGYPVFTKSKRLDSLRWLNSIPRSIRATIGRLLKSLKPGIASAKIATILEQSDISALSAYPSYRQVLMDDQIRKIMNDNGFAGNRVQTIINELSNDDHYSRLGLLSQISIAEMTTYMQHVLLRDTDQMSMAHALEVRVPFLDHELVELVIGLPDSIKFPHSPKSLLVDSLGDLLPREVVDRPKMGFTLPYEKWMKNELREFCRQRISLLADNNMFNGDVLYQYWKDFVNGNPELSWSRLWMLVVLGHWIDKNDVN